MGQESRVVRNVSTVIEEDSSHAGYTLNAVGILALCKIIRITHDRAL